MAMSQRFIFSFFFSILSSFLFLKLHQHLSSSLMIELQQLKSRVSVLESRIEMFNHVLRSKEDDIAKMVKIILNNEESIASVKNKIDCAQQKGSADVEGQMNAGHSQFAEFAKQEWIPVMKNQLLSFIYSLKPHFQFLTSVTTEACHASMKSLQSHIVKLLRSAIPFMQEWIPVMKNQLSSFIYSLEPHFQFLTSVTTEACHAFMKSLQSHIVKLLRSAIPFMQELQKSAMPYIKKIATATNIFLKMALASLGTLFKKICSLLLDLWN